MNFFQQTVAYLLLTVAYAVASTLVFEAHTDDSITPSLQDWTKTQTLVVAVSQNQYFKYQNPTKLVYLITLLFQDWTKTQNLVTLSSVKHMAFFICIRLNLRNVLSIAVTD